MRKTISTAVFVLTLFAVTFSCRKTTADWTPSNTGSSTNNIPFPQSTEVQCQEGPDYGDSILFQQPTTSQDYFVAPVNDPGPGQYFSWPIGLSINNSTGVIDLSQSETGQRYVIGFVKSGSHDTCLHPIIIGGSSYIDSIYSLSLSDTTAPPYFNANPNTPSPCTGGNQNLQACKFLSTQKLNGRDLIMDLKTGVIDLKASYLNGIFGPSPYNGETVTANIKYNLSDPSNNALQSIQVNLIFYNSRSDIPQSVLNEINAKRTDILNNTIILASPVPKPRPPLIIITRLN